VTKPAITKPNTYKVNTDKPNPPEEPIKTSIKLDTILQTSRKTDIQINPTSFKPDTSLDVTPPAIVDTSEKSKTPDKTDSSTGTESSPGVSNNAGFGKSNKSSGISIGVIIGVIAGVIGVVSIIILVICYCKKCKNNPENKNGISESSVSDISVGRSQNDELINENEFKKSKFIFETTRQLKIQVDIEQNKPAKELIKLFFEKIERPDLYNDTSIRFLWSGNLVAHDSNELLQKLLNKKSVGNKIVVDDLDDKIKSFPNESNNSQQ